MEKQPWSVWKAALLGLVLGGILAPLREFTAEDGLVPQNFAEWANLVGSGSLSGLVLFWLGAFLRNMWIKS